MIVDRDTLITLVANVLNEALDFLNEEKEPVNFEAFARAFGNSFVELSASLSQPGMGVQADLKKCAAYGLVYGAMDSMYICDPHVLRKEYADRKELELN